MEQLVSLSLQVVSTNVKIAQKLQGINNEINESIEVKEFTRKSLQIKL